MTTWKNIKKNGTIIGGWTYNEDLYTYDQLLDVSNNNNVYYNGVGITTVWSNLPKI